MKVDRILFTVIILIGLCIPCQGIFGGTSLQDFVDDIVDAAKSHFEGILSLNDSAIGEIWYFFKSKYRRVYSSIG
jgi:hypothetical protein